MHILIVLLASLFELKHSKTAEDFKLKSNLSSLMTGIIFIVFFFFFECEGVL